MRVEFTREPSRRETLDHNESPVCVVGTHRGDPQASLPEALQGSLVRSFRPAPRRRLRLTDSAPVGADDARVDILQVSSPLTLPHLPGLESPHRSRLRDSVALLLEKMPAVLVTMVTSTSVAPLDEPDVLVQLKLGLEQLAGRLVLFPDLDPIEPLSGGPEASPRILADRLRARFQTWEGTLHGVAPLFRELFLTGLVDAPQPPTDALLRLADTHLPAVTLQSGLRDLEALWWELLDDALPRLVGLDLGVCAWTGAWEALRAQGWRSSAALAARLLGSHRGSSAMAQLERRRVDLPPARKSLSSRVNALLGGLPDGLILRPDLRRQLIIASLSDNAEVCTFEGQRCLRALAGFWTVPAVRTLKEIELTLRRVAEAFVFQPATQSMALELKNAIHFGLDEHLMSGVLGPLDSPEEMVRVWPDQGEVPGLVAQIVATLRPWSHTLRIRLAVRPQGIQLEAA